MDLRFCLLVGILLLAIPQESETTRVSTFLWNLISRIPGFNTIYRRKIMQQLTDSILDEIVNTNVDTVALTLKRQKAMNALDSFSVKSAKNADDALEAVDDTIKRVDDVADEGANAIVAKSTKTVARPISIEDEFANIVSDTRLLRQRFHGLPAQYVPSQTLPLRDLDEILISSLPMRNMMHRRPFNSEFLRRAAKKFRVDSPNRIRFGPVRKELMQKGIYQPRPLFLQHLKKTPLKEVLFQVGRYLNWRQAHPIKSIAIDTLATGSFVGLLNGIVYEEYHRVDDAVFNETLTLLDKFGSAENNSLNDVLLARQQEIYVHSVVQFTLAWLMNEIKDQYGIDLTPSSVLTNTEAIRDFYTQIKIHPNLQNLTTDDFLKIIDIEKLDLEVHNLALENSRDPDQIANFYSSGDLNAIVMRAITDRSEDVMQIQKFEVKPTNSTAEFLEKLLE